MEDRKSWNGFNEMCCGYKNIYWLKLDGRIYWTLFVCKLVEYYPSVACAYGSFDGAKALRIDKYTYIGDRSQTRAYSIICRWSAIVDTSQIRIPCTNGAGKVRGGEG